MHARRSANASLPMRATVRGIFTGAVIGAVVGIAVAFVVHEIVASDASLWLYEIPGILLGAVVGIGLGMFYGGALHLPRDRDRPAGPNTPNAPNKEHP